MCVCYNFGALETSAPPETVELCVCVCYAFVTVRVRRPIRLRSVPDQIAFGARWHLVGGYGIPIYPLQNDKKRLNACGYSLSLEKKE